MRGRLGAFLLAGGAATLAVAVSAGSASGATATGWSVSPGGMFKGKQSGLVKIVDRGTHKSVVCADTAATGSFKSGTGLPGAGIGSLRSLSLTSCTGPGGVAFTVTTGAMPWSLNAVKYIAAKHTTDGTLTGIHLTLAATGCSATIDGTGATSDNGSVVIHIHNSPSKLKFEAAGGTLHIYVSKGCTGIFKSGTEVIVNNAYLLSPAQNLSESS